MRRPIRIFGKVVPAWVLALTIFVCVAGVAIAAAFYAMLTAQYAITSVPGIELVWGDGAPPVAPDPWDIDTWICDKPTGAFEGYNLIQTGGAKARLHVQILPDALANFPGIEEGDYLVKVERYGTDWQEIVAAQDLYNLVPGHTGCSIPYLDNWDAGIGTPRGPWRICYKSMRAQTPLASGDLSLYFIATPSGEAAPVCNTSEMLPFPSGDPIYGP